MRATRYFAALVDDNVARLTSDIMKPTIALLFAFLSVHLSAAQLTVRLTNAPDAGDLVFQVYDAADKFRDFRDPVQSIVVPAVGDGDYLLPDVVGESIALLVYHDQNGNGRIDKNFIGIPRERLALSNNYQPKGPPNFSRASFDPSQVDIRTVDMQMYQLLGERGRFGIGVGAIARSSPYAGSTQSVTQAIPAITYFGDRLQWFGPALRYGLAGGGNLRLAFAAEYRIASYEEDDSSVLLGLGDRDSTLTAGLSLQYEISKGFELDIGYQHDVLDRIGGGIANVRLSRGVPVGPATFVPQVSVNWLGSEMSNHNFGVPAAASNANRPAYRLGSTTSYELGLGTFIELSEDWQIVVNVSGERLNSAVTASPIVGDKTLVRGFAMISYVF
jgi:outer membrane protein